MLFELRRTRGKSSQTFLGKIAMADQSISARNTALGPFSQQHMAASTSLDTAPDMAAQWRHDIGEAIRFYDIGEATRLYNIVETIRFYDIVETTRCQSPPNTHFDTRPAELRQVLTRLLEGEGPKSEQEFADDAIHLLDSHAVSPVVLEKFLAHPHFSTLECGLHRARKALNDTGIANLAYVLQRNATIETLGLDASPCRFFLAVLIDAVQQNKTLTSFTLKYSPHSDGMRSTRPFFSMLLHNTSLQTFKLILTEPDCRDPALVFRALKKNKTLRQLELTNYPVVSCLRSLLAMLKENSTLTHLRIDTTEPFASSNDKAEVLACLAETLKSNAVLQELVWEDLGLLPDDAECKAAQASHATGLAASPTTNTENAGDPIPVSPDIAAIKACLQRNRNINFWAIVGATHSLVTHTQNLPLPYDVAKEIAGYVADAPWDSARAVVHVNHGTHDAARHETILRWFEAQRPASDEQAVQNQAPSLSGLDLSDDKFPAHRCDVLFEALRSRLPFDSLDLSYCKLGDMAIGKLANLLASNPAIQSVNLSGNAISPSACKALIGALKTNDKLTSLDLSYCKLDDKQVGKLAQLLSSHSSIQTVNLSGNRIFVPGLQKLRSAAKANAALVEIKIDYNEINIRESAVLRELRGTLADNAQRNKQ